MVGVRVFKHEHSRYRFSVIGMFFNELLHKPQPCCAFERTLKPLFLVIQHLFPNLIGNKFSKLFEQQWH